jgi:hypothetical protein
VVRSGGDDPRLGAVLSASALFFVKIHGSINAGNIVFGTEDYDRTYVTTPQMSSFLTALMLRYHLVFIGCSLEDELLRLRRKLSFDFKGQIPTAYALLSGDDHNRHRETWLREHAQIETVLYSQLDRSHVSVDQFLRQAAACSDHTDRQSVAGVTQTELLKLTPRERWSRIGEANLELLKFVSRLPRKEVHHLDLLNPERLAADRDIGPLLAGLTPEERVYRALFLTAIGLLTERVGHDGAARYSLTPDAISLAGTKY